MPVFTSIVIAAVSAAVGIASVLESKKQAKSQRRAQQKAETEAREGAALKSTREDTGADILLGSADRDKTGKPLKTSDTTKAPVANSVLGGVSTTQRVGL